ncbi:MAG: pyridoxal-phosphate dependent enzyme [bacterium]
MSETPVERWVVDGVRLLAKRDDLSAPTLGGNKVRALEFLLAGVGPDHTLLTVGPTGSTHALAVAQYGTRLGAQTEVLTWPQEQHHVARATAARLERRARVTHTSSPVEAYLRAGIRRLRRDVRWIPAGGSVPLGAIGHVNAALELVGQLARASMPMPSTIVAPLGSGGTVAGLLVGLAMVGAPTTIVGVRVVPRIVANRRRVLSLARRTRALLARLAQQPLMAVDEDRLQIDEQSYGGAYGRETLSAQHASRLLIDAGGPSLDGTYSAKTFASALERARVTGDESVLFWLTFDGRWLDTRDEEPHTPRPSR